jgi:hypothetical protein
MAEVSVQFKACLLDVQSRRADVDTDIMLLFGDADALAAEALYDWITKEGSAGVEVIIRSLDG